MSPDTDNIAVHRQQYFCTPWIILVRSNWHAIEINTLVRALKRFQNRSRPRLHIKSSRFGVTTMIPALRFRGAAMLFVATWLLGNLVRDARGQVASCTFCYDGSEPVWLNTAPAELSGMTCADFQAIVALEPAGTPTCDDYQTVGFACGCPIPPDRCPMCYDEGLPSPELLDYTVPLAGLNLTCRTLYMAAGSTLRDESLDACDAFPGFGILCGCVFPPTGCQLCADGSLPPDLDFVIPGKCSFFVLNNIFADD